MNPLTPRRIYRGLKRRYLQKFSSAKNFASYLYYLSFGRKINWMNPEDLNQWINWLEFNTDTTQWVRLADKYAVREYISEKGFNDILVPLLNVWDNPDEISFDGLPDKFVLKMNNGSGDVRIISDKKSADLFEIKSYFRKMFSHRFGLDSAEPHYTKINPVVIAEELLDVSKQDSESMSLIDYKFWCFNGQPYCCFVCSDRTKDSLTIDLYTANEQWERIDERNINYDKVHLKATKNMPRPKCISKMLDIASKLSEGFPQIRVDFYEVGGSVYFGELTLTSACGRMNYFTDKFLKEMGERCRIGYSEIN